MAKPVPDKLARRGLASVQENLPAGRVPGGFARDFALIFRDELAARFVVRPPACAPAPDAPPSSALASACPE